MLALIFHVSTAIILKIIFWKEFSAKNAFSATASIAKILPLARNALMATIFLAYKHAFSVTSLDVSTVR